MKHQLASTMADQLIAQDLLSISSTPDAVTNSIRYRATLFAAKPKDGIVGGPK